METYYKSMLENGETIFGRSGWALPRGKRPGKWMPKIANPILCDSGYHVCTIEQLPEFIGPAIYVVEVRGAFSADSTKSTWEQARLLHRIDGWGMKQMVEWTQACADQVAHLQDVRYAAGYAARHAKYAGYARDAARNAKYAAGYAGYVARGAKYAAGCAELRWQIELLASMLGVSC